MAYNAMEQDPTEEERMVQAGFSIPRGDSERLEQLAKYECRSVSSLVRMFIRRGLERAEDERRAAETPPNAETASVSPQPECLGEGRQ
jgi:predicted DNA-binding protein